MYDDLFIGWLPVKERKMAAKIVTWLEKDCVKCHVLPEKVWIFCGCTLINKKVPKKVNWDCDAYY